MMRVGIRELRQRASELLRMVAAGETLEITDRGRPVALLGPIPDVDPLQGLRDTGQVSGPVGRVEDLPDPIELAPGQPAPSDVLARLRDDER